MKNNLRNKLINIFYVVVFFMIFLIFGCRRSDFDSFVKNHLRNQNNPGEGILLAKMGDLFLTSKNFQYFHANGKVYKREGIPEGAIALRRELYKKQFIRKKIIGMGLAEKMYSDKRAMEYIWPRLEKILEEFYYYRKLDYKKIRERKTRRYLGENALKSFYKNNKKFFKNEKLKLSQVRTLLENRIDKMVEAEYNKKKNELYKEILSKDTIKILYGKRKRF